MPTAKKACPALTFKTQIRRGARQTHYVVGAFGSVHLGEISGWAQTKNLRIDNILVSDRYRRCGIGTKLYEQLAAIACKLGLTLASDDVLEPEAEAFWQKQVRKGRAFRDRREKVYKLKNSCVESLDGARGRRK